jgi:predicted metal-binding membrane protein
MASVGDQAVAAQRPNATARPLGRGAVALVAALVALAGIAWLVTAERMRGMDAGPGTDVGSLGFYVSVWVVMMAAMMFPSIAPMVVMHARIQAGRVNDGRARRSRLTALFVAGYLVAWTTFGLAAYALLTLGRSLSINALSWDRGGPYIAGGVVCAAAVYQLTPLKDACLSRCRSPFWFLLHRWRQGRLGALGMGASHGAWCVGCCWALMATLFALGVMSVGWMAFVAALIAVEKLLPWKAVANRAIAVLLLMLGLAVALAPDRVPGLTLPNESRMSMSDATHDMRPPTAHAAPRSAAGGGGVAMPTTDAMH